MTQTMAQTLLDAADGQADGAYTLSRLRNAFLGIVPVESTVAFAPTITWNLDTDPVAKLTVTGTITITAAGGLNGRTYRLRVTQDSTGARPITLAGVTVIGGVNWDTTANGVTEIVVTMSNSVRYATVGVPSGTSTTNFPITSVVTYGATGNGSTDDTAAINSAIAAAGTGTVLFPAGSYKITSAITVTTTTALQFQQGATITLANSSNCNIFILQAACSMTGLGVLDLNGANNTGGGNDFACIQIDNADRCRISGLELKNYHYAGIAVLGSSHNTIENCYIHTTLGTAYGVFMNRSSSRGSTYNLVRGNHIDSSGNGVWTGGDGAFPPTVLSSHNIISNNEITSHRIAIEVWGGSPYSTISGNTIVSLDDNGGWGWGISADASDYSSITGNTINCKAYTGVEIAASSHCTVAANTVYGNATASHGVIVSDVRGTSTTITGNNVNACAKGVYTECPYTVIDGNMLTNITSNGVEINGGDHQIIVGNHIDTSGTAIIVEEASYVVVSSNEFTAGENGVQFLASGPTTRDFLSATNNLGVATINLLTFTGTFYGTSLVYDYISQASLGSTKFGTAGGVQVQFTNVANAVNWVALGGSVTGSPVTVSPAGDDSNISLNLVTKGTGTVQVNGSPISSITQISTYYVDSASGSDGNAGTGTGSAWATLGHALSHGLNAGDTLYLKTGSTFRTTFSVPQGVNVTSYGGGTTLPIVTPSVLLTSWTLDSGSIYKATVPSGWSAALTQGIWENTVKGVSVGSKGAITTGGNFWLDNTNHLIYYRTRGGGSPAGYTMEADNNSYAMTFAGTFGSISNVVFTQCGGSCFIGDSTTIQTGWTFTNCTFGNAQIHGYLHNNPGSGSTFKRCTFNKCGYAGAYASPSAGMLFSDCVFDSNGLSNQNTAALDVNNDLDTGNGASRIERCVFSNNGGDGLSISQHAIDDIITDCIAFNNGTLINDRTGMKTFGLRTRFQNCLSYNNNLGFTDGSGFQTDHSGSGTPIVADSCTFYNCVAFGNQFSGFSFDGGNHTMTGCRSYENLTCGIEWFGSQSKSNFTMRGCEVYGNGGSTTTNFELNDSSGGMSGATGIIIDRCIIKRQASHPNIIHYAGTNYATLAAFVTATGFGGTSIEDRFTTVLSYDLTQTTQTASYTLVLGDSGTSIDMNNASALNLTVPPNSSVAFTTGTIIDITQYGAGQVTIVAGAGVTLRNPSSLTSRAQYSTITLRKRATDEWIVGGDLT